MNARIDESSVRIRLLVSDVATLASEGCIRCSIAFRPENLAFSYRVEAADVEQASAIFADGVLTVKIPRDFAAAWPMNEDAGVSARCGDILVSVEKDLRRAKSWRAEGDDTQRYPNPRVSRTAESN